jgi:GT2 family glycosyltransferase
MTQSLLPDVVRRLIKSGLIDPAIACPYLPADKIYYEEILDSFMILTDEERRQAFPFFDAEYYLAQFNSNAEIDFNPLSHFFEFGFASGIAPHPLIKPTYMTRAHPDLFGARMRLDHFASALIFDWCDPSPFLWLAWYRDQARLPPSEGALLHYLKRGAKLNLPPNPYFQPETYAAGAPDAPRNGIELVRHFMTQDDAASAAVGDRFDPAFYARQHPESMASGGPLQHFLSVGRSLGHSPCETAKAPDEQVTLSAATNDVPIFESPAAILDRWTGFNDDVAKARRAGLEAFRERNICPVAIEDHLAALKELAFAQEHAPDVDVLIPCYDEFEITVECLVALSRARLRRKLRIIVADDASRDERVRLLEQVPGLTFIRHPENLNFLRSCNRAFAATDAPLMLLLNNDTQVFDDAIDRLADAIEADDRIGAAAPMFLYPNGRLQEAGCALRFDGESAMTGVGDDPERSCYAYAREIDYGSGAGLMLRRDALEGALFDEQFAPAYCEDADLCLRIRERGWRVVYEPAARVVHHLSVSAGRESRRRRVQLARTNQQKLMEKWGPQLREQNRARVLAFYLPQFHPIDRNNVWWGRGFTDWTNVTRATPSFAGHYQPHLPADLGFYDLRRVETMGEQQALARQYGIEGFAVYYYNFGANRVLEQPMEALLKHPEIDFRFALCWANENWTRHWDGGARSMLLEQLYDDATLDSVATDMARFACDPRAIRVDGKPLVMVYRPLQIPDVLKATQHIRARFAEAGHAEIHLVYVESMEAIERRVRPAEIGFDACIEFPPQGIAEPYKSPVKPLKAGWDGHLYDYAGTARNAVLRQTTDYPRYPAVTPSWDNTARQPLNGTTLVGAEPELFQAYVEHKLEEMLDFQVGERRLLFVNAWNEWAEGAHLEPDRGFGHRWLAALRLALLSKGVIA